jgi:hypothetical protein
LVAGAAFSSGASDTAYLRLTSRRAYAIV